MSQENVEAVRRAHAAFNRGGPLSLEIRLADTGVTGCEFRRQGERSMRCKQDLSGYSSLPSLLRSAARAQHGRQASIPTTGSQPTTATASASPATAERRPGSSRMFVAADRVPSVSAG